MSRLRATLPAIVLTCAVLAGCRAGPSSSGPVAINFPSGSLPVLPSAEPEATPPGPPPNPGAVPPSGSGETPAPAATPHDDPDLERTLALSFGDVALETWSLHGDAALTGAAYLPELVEGLGRSATDLSTAVGGDPSGQFDILVFGLRVRGAAQADLLRAFLVLTSNESAAEDTLANRAVRRVDHETTQTWIYLAGDALFLVQTSDPGIAAEVVSRLP